MDRAAGEGGRRRLARFRLAHDRDHAVLADAGHAAAEAARRLRPGDRCVVIGGLGRIGVQVLRVVAEVVVVDRDPDAVKLARAVGADHGSSRTVRAPRRFRPVAAVRRPVIDFVGEGGPLAAVWPCCGGRVRGRAILTP